MKDNPYLLSGEQYGVPFSATDEIALSMGFGGDSPCRTEAAMTYELTHNLGNGHVFLPARTSSSPRRRSSSTVGPERVEITLDELIERKAIVQEQVANVLACYLRRMYEAETFVAQRLLAMVKQPFETGRSVEKIIREIEVQQGIDYAPQQRQAVALAAHEGVLVITGGPGTGKTTSTPGHRGAV